MGYLKMDESGEEFVTELLQAKAVNRLSELFGCRKATLSTCSSIRSGPSFEVVIQHDSRFTLQARNYDSINLVINNLDLREF